MGDKNSDLIMIYWDLMDIEQWLFIGFHSDVMVI